MGKSSTVNSILAEPVAQVVVMQAPVSRAQTYSRTAAGFTLTLIDTPGVLEGDAVDGAVRALLLILVVGSQGWASWKENALTAQRWPVFAHHLTFM